MVFPVACCTESDPDQNVAAILRSKEELQHRTTSRMFWFCKSLSNIVMIAFSQKERVFRVDRHKQRRTGATRTFKTNSYYYLRSRDSSTNDIASTTAVHCGYQYDQNEPNYLRELLYRIVIAKRKH